MKKFIIFVLLVLAIGVQAFEYAPRDTYNGQVLQTVRPTSHGSKSCGTKGYANISTASMFGFNYQAMDSSNNTVPVKKRNGGFTAAGQASFPKPDGSGTHVVSPGQIKVGMECYSSNLIKTIHYEY